jgi:hypothetical protein
MDKWQAVRCAAHLEMLDEVARMDRDEAWTFDGAASMSGWLVARYGLSHHTASEWTRVAHAIQDLPAIRAAFATGRMSWDQVRTATRFASSDTDDKIAETAPSMTVTQLRRQAREVKLADVQQAHHDRFFTWNFDENHPVVDFRGRLVDTEGAIIIKALTRMAARMQRVDDAFEPFEARYADALVQLASQGLGADSDPDRATVVVHVDATQLATGKGLGIMEEGPAIIAETARRLMCDCRWQVNLEDADQRVIGIGRVSRSIPPWLARKLRKRDKGCRFPGCERTRWIHFHHIIHWANGGPTDLDNLITVCPMHHRLIHEAEWRISGDPNGEVLWIQPGGSPFPRGQEWVARGKPPYASDEIFLPDHLRTGDGFDTS